jgi:hypothetical protein
MRTQLTEERSDGRDLNRLIDVVRQKGDGRVYAGLRANWGKQYKVGFVPVHAWLANHEIDAIGFTFRTVTSLSTDIEAAFDETNPAQYEMMNVRYLLLPSDRTPPVPATLIGQSGRHRLYEVATTGYFQVVDRAGSLSGNRMNLQNATRDFRRSRLASQGIYPSVAFSGATPVKPSGSGGNAASPAGTVLAQRHELSNGVFDGAVQANRDAVVLLKATYDPRWRVTVDGKPARTVMMAPSLVGVDVPSGVHTVSFQYIPYGAYPLLLALGVLTLLGLYLLPRRFAKVALVERNSDAIAA